MGATAGQQRPDLTFETFWQEAVSAYGREGAAPLLLELQDLDGADVNLILLLAFLDRRQHDVTTAHLRGLLELSEEWQSRYLRPHRQQRRAAKGGDTARYEALKSQELALEMRASQALFTEAMRGIGAQAGSDTPALGRYLEELGTAVTTDRVLRALRF